MATRSIVTSQPDVACDVCGRRLLRGELPDVFLAGGQRRTVCELCAPRAAHEGWLREADRHSVSLPPSRARRGRNLFERLRPQREPSAARAAEDFAGEGLGIVPSVAVEGYQTESYDFLEAIAVAPEDPEQRWRRSSRARIWPKTSPGARPDRRRAEGRAGAGGVQRR